MVNRAILLLGISLVVLVSITLILVGVLNKEPLNDSAESLNNTEPARLTFTDVDEDALIQFRSVMKPEELYAPFMRSDPYLLRWIRDSDYDLEAAAAKFRKSLQWRKDNQIDTILEEDYSDILRDCPYTMDGHDRDGNPLAVIPFGSWKLRRVAIGGNMERLNRLTFFVFENSRRILSKLERAGKDVDAVILVDFNGFSYIEHACLKCLPLLSNLFSVFENNYPHTVKHWYLINVPRLGQFVIDMMLPFLSANSRQIMQIYGYDRAEWTAEILKTISPDQLPDQFPVKLNQTSE